MFEADKIIIITFLRTYYLNIKIINEYQIKTNT